MTTKEKNMNYFLHNLDEVDVRIMKRMIMNSYSWEFKLPEDVKEFMSEAPEEEWKQIGQGAWFLAFGWLHQQNDGWEDPVLNFEDYCNFWQKKLVEKDNVPFIAYLLMVAGFSQLLEQWEKQGMEKVK